MGNKIKKQMGNMSMTSKLVLAFVMLLLGVVFVGVIATQGLAVTDKTAKVDEPFDMSNAFNGTGHINTTYVFTVSEPPTSWKVADCPLTLVTVSNGTIGVGTDLTLTTDYLITLTTGDLTFLDTAAVNQTFLSDNATYIDYTYCDDGYMNLTWGRTGINLVAGFFALGLLMVSLGLFYSIAKDSGLI